MAIKNYIEFQIAEYAAQKEFLSTQVTSGGEKHGVLNLARAYMSEIVKENSSVLPIRNIDDVLRAKQSSDESSFVDVFGKSIANILYNLDDFDADFPKFLKAYHILFFGETKFKALHDKFNYGRYVLQDDTTPFIVSEVQVRKNLGDNFESPSSLNRPNQLFQPPYQLFKTKIDQFNHKEFSEFFISASKKFATCFTDNSLFYCPLPVNFNYTGFFKEDKDVFVTVLNSTPDFNSPNWISDNAVEKNYEIPAAPDYYTKEKAAQDALSALTANDYESVKLRMFGINQDQFMKNEGAIFNLIQLKQNVLSKEKGKLYDVVKVPSDIILSFDQLQTQQIVVDAHAFAMLFLQIRSFNLSEKISFASDGEYLYILTDQNVTREEVITKVVDGEEFFKKVSVTRKLFGRVKIKTGNFAKLSHYVWLYKYDASITLREILKSVTEEDLSTISIPTDFLHQKQILASKQRTAIERNEDKLTTSGKDGLDFLEELTKSAEKFILSYAEKVPGGWYEPRKDNVGMNNGPGLINSYYVYKVNEIFWRNNKSVSIEELIAYFIAKGDDYNYRLLSYRILGFDAFLYKDKLLIPLLQKVLICIEEFAINIATKEIVKPIKLAYRQEYVTGNYFDKAKNVRIGITEDDIEELDRKDVKDLYDSCIAYFGKELGETIIANQVDWLNKNKPIQMTFDGREEDGNLLAPTLYDPKLFNYEDPDGMDDPDTKEKPKPIAKLTKAFFEATTYSPFDESIQKIDFETLYKKRAKAGDYIVRYFSVNLFYDIRLIEEEVRGKKQKTYCVFGKGNNAVLYKGEGKDSESDCKEWADDNLNNGKLLFSRIEKALKVKDDISMVEDKPKFRKAGIMGISVINKKYIGEEYSEEEYGYAQFYSMFQMDTYKMLHLTGFISDKTWKELFSITYVNRSDSDRIKIGAAVLDSRGNFKEIEDVSSSTTLKLRGGKDVNISDVKFPKLTIVTGDIVYKELQKAGRNEVDPQQWMDTAKEMLVVLPPHEGKVIFDMVVQEFNLLYSKTIKEGDLQFARYLKANKYYADLYEYMWNYTYNSSMHPYKEKEIEFFDDNGKPFPKIERLYDNSKFPIFLEHTRYFGDNVETELSLQDSQIDGVKYYASNGNSALLAHEVGFGKLSKKTTPIITPTGYRKMGDLKVGDDVIARNGKPTKVNGVFPQGKKDIYDITFDDGSSTDCGAEHLWKVNSESGWEVLEAKELIKRGLFKNDGSLRYSIPMVEPVHFKEQPVPTAPYFMGSMIGANAFSCSEMGWSSGSVFLYDEVAAIIPDIYKFNSVENRLQLLRGLMDEAGEIENGKVIFYASEEKLAKDVKFLIESFGGIVSVNESFTITIKLPESVLPFSLPEKVIAYNNIEHGQPIRYIVSIELSGNEEAQCISVEDAEHLYVCDDFIVTHNTIAAICCVVHSLITGQARRPFISAPAQVYKNFGKEIHGETGSFRGMLPHIPLLKLLNAKPRVFLKYDKNLKQIGGIKTYSENQIKIINDFNKVKKVKKDIISDKYNKKIALNPNAENSYENFIKEFEKFLTRNVPLWRTEPNFKEITFDKFKAMYDRLKTEYEAAIKEDNEEYSSKIDALIDGKSRTFNKIKQVEGAKMEKEKGIYNGKDYREKQTIYRTRIDKLQEQYEEGLKEKLTKALLRKEEKYSKRLAKYIVSSIAVLAKKIYDALGYYADEFMSDKAIVISSHTAIPDFEIEYDDAIDACKELNLKDEKADTLSNKPVSFSKLDCDMIVIDEIHNFNEYYSKSSKINIQYGNNRSNKLNLRCDYGTQDASMSTNKGAIKFETKGIQTKETKIILSRLLMANYKKNIAERGISNNIVMSATPFVDNLYQMVSVFNMLKSSMKVVDFYSNFCYENWTYGVGSKGEVKYEAQISSFKNKVARNAYIKSNCQFYTFDKQIEERRPKKFIFPYVGDEKDAILWKCYTEASSSIPLSEPQMYLVKNIGKFLYGEIGIEDIAPLKEPESTLKKKELKDFKEEMEAFRDVVLPGGDIEETERFVKDNELLSYSKKDEGYDILKELLDALETEADKSNYVLFYKESAATNDEDDESDDSVSEVEADSIRNAGAKLSFSSVKQQRVCLSPYMVGYQKIDGEKGSMENAMLPSLFGNAPDVVKDSAKVFVENSPKILFAINAVLQTIQYHKDRNEDISGQIMFISKGENFRYGGIMYNAHQLISNYLMNYGDLNKTHIIKVYDEENEVDIDIEVKEIETLVGSTQVLKKKAIETGFNNGLVKVIIGSESIREGINLQGINKLNRKHGTSTIYILTPDYSPMTFLQLEGRGWRQGNPLDNIRIVYILHKNSVDQHVYSRLKTKINQVKALLEAGIYEANSTQFQQDIEGVAEFLTTDIEKKIDVRWRGKKTILESKIKEYNQKGEKLDHIKNNYGSAKTYLNTVIPFVNDYGRFVQMADIVYTISDTPYYNLERKEVIELKNKLKSVEDKFNIEIKEKIDVPVNEEFDKMVAAWKEKKAAHNEKVKEIKEKEKERIQVLKDKAKAAEKAVEDAKKKVASGVPEIKGLTKSLEELELDAKLAVIGTGNTTVALPEFTEEEPTTKEKNLLKGKYVDVIVEINNRRKAELAAEYKRGCEAILLLCQHKDTGAEFCRSNDIYYREEISSSSTSYQISNQAKRLTENYRFRTSGPVSETGPYASYKYVQSKDIFESGSGIGKEYSARLDFAYFHDILYRQNEYVKDELIDKSYLSEFYYTKFLTLHAQYLNLIRDGEYSDKAKTLYLKMYGLGSTGKNVVAQLTSGQYIIELIANYENLVIASGKTIDTIDELSKKIMEAKEASLEDTLKETNFKDTLRVEYKAKELKLAEERKGLTDLIGYVNFEVQKFAISNKMLYFRDAENMHDMRKELAEEK